MVQWLYYTRLDRPGLPAAAVSRRAAKWSPPACAPSWRTGRARPRRLLPRRPTWRSAAGDLDAPASARLTRLPTCVAGHRRVADGARDLRACRPPRRQHRNHYDSMIRRLVAEIASSDFRFQIDWAIESAINLQSEICNSLVSRRPSDRCASLAARAIARQQRRRREQQQHDGERHPVGRADLC